MKTTFREGLNMPASVQVQELAAELAHRRNSALGSIGNDILPFLGGDICAQQVAQTADAFSSNIGTTPPVPHCEGAITPHESSTDFKVLATTTPPPDLPRTLEQGGECDGQPLITGATSSTSLDGKCFEQLSNGCSSSSCGPPPSVSCDEPLPAPPNVVPTETQGDGTAPDGGDVDTCTRQGGDDHTTKPSTEDCVEEITDGHEVQTQSSKVGDQERLMLGVGCTTLSAEAVLPTSSPINEDGHPMEKIEPSAGTNEDIVRYQDDSTPIYCPVGTNIPAPQIGSIFHDTNAKQDHCPESLSAPAFSQEDVDNGSMPRLADAETCPPGGDALLSNTDQLTTPVDHPEQSSIEAIAVCQETVQEITTPTGAIDTTLHEESEAPCEAKVDEVEDIPATNGSAVEVVEGDTTPIPAADMLAPAFSGTNGPPCSTLHSPSPACEAESSHDPASSGQSKELASHVEPCSNPTQNGEDDNAANFDGGIGCSNQDSTTDEKDADAQPQTMFSISASVGVRDHSEDVGSGGNAETLQETGHDDETVAPDASGDGDMSGLLQMVQESVAGLSQSGISQIPSLLEARRVVPSKPVPPTNSASLSQGSPQGAPVKVTSAKRTSLKGIADTIVVPDRVAVEEMGKTYKQLVDWEQSFACLKGKLSKAKKSVGSNLQVLINDIDEIHDNAARASQAAKKSIEACHKIACNISKHLSSCSDKTNVFRELPDRFNADLDDFKEESKAMEDHVNLMLLKLKSSIARLSANGDKGNGGTPTPPPSGPGLLVKLGSLAGVGGIVRAVELVIGIFMAIAGIKHWKRYQKLKCFEYVLEETQKKFEKYQTWLQIITNITNASQRTEWKVDVSRLAKDWKAREEAFEKHVGKSNEKTA